MAKCPNCGQETTGDYCQWCKYPMVKDVPEKPTKAEKRAKVKKDKTDVAPHPMIIIDPVQKAKDVEKCLEEVESICKELKAGKVETREALEKLSDIL